MKKPEGSLISYFSRKTLKSQGLNLAQGKPGFTPPIQLLNILKKKTENDRLHQYAPGNGNFELLNVLEKYYSKYKSVSLNNLLIVQGATEGIFLTFFYLTTILNKPYSALSFDPAYESYPELAKIMAIPFEYYDFEDDLSIDFQKLETIIREKKVKIIFIASPGNPLGKAWNSEEIRNIILTLSMKKEIKRYNRQKIMKISTKKDYSKK